MNENTLKPVQPLKQTSNNVRNILFVGEFQHTSTPYLWGCCTFSVSQLMAKLELLNAAFGGLVPV